MFGISSLFERHVLGYTVLGVIVVLIIVMIGAYLFYFFNYKGGRERIEAYIFRRGELQKAYASLPEDIALLKTELEALKGSPLEAKKQVV